MIPNDPTPRGLVRVRRKGQTEGESNVNRRAFEAGIYPDLELVPDGGDDGAHYPAPFFDPNEHTIKEVIDYVDQGDGDEKQRVLDLEAAGRSRAGLTGLADQAVTDEP